ncbi:aminoacyl-tRNA deacylase [Nigerium massiliense]|uniref:aminoacyl-tRNA deacylase n=1 Tax=Nigerium massiliense TaxID=1522317 RepID=UPI00058B7DA4|nr:YbaK/EbsC family protein [Nigerium massiliense]
MTNPALTAAEALGLDARLVRHAPVTSLEEAARLRGIEPRALVKTLVVRRGEDDYVFVLVPGDKGFSWPKLRALLGVNRLSMPDAATAKDVTGYARGTITPFGSTRAWPVIADASIAGPISLGAGEPNAGLLLNADAALAALGAQRADIVD